MHRSKINKFLLFTCIYLLNCAFIPFSSILAQDFPVTNKIEALKEFLAKPPVVSEMLIVVNEYPDENKGGIRKLQRGYLIIRTNPTYRLFWNIGSFMLESANSEPITIQEITNKIVVDTRWSCGYMANDLTKSNYCWYAKPGDQITYYYGSMEPKTNGIGVHDLVRKKYEFSLPLLSFGISGLVPGSLTWTNDTFFGKHIGGGSIKGVLYMSSNAQPSHIIYTLLPHNRNYCVSYTYSTNDYFYNLPSEFSRKPVLDGSSALIELKGKVLALQIGTVGNMNYSLSNKLGTNYLRVYEQSRDGTSYKEQGKTMRVVGAVKAHPKSHSSIVFGVLIVNLFIGVFVIVKLYKKTKRKL